MTFDIRQIWDSIRAGDAAAWRQLVHAYASLVFTVARRVGLDTADAEDCAQQTWLALYRNRRTITDPTAIPAWLIRTSHRKALTIRQKTTRSQQSEISDVLHDTAALPDDVLVSLEQAAVLEVALTQLDPRCRQVLTSLFYSSGDASYAEIAQALKIQPNSLGPLRSRCLEKLRKILKNLGYDPD